MLIRLQFTVRILPRNRGAMSISEESDSFEFAISNTEVRWKWNFVKNSYCLCEVASISDIWHSHHLLIVFWGDCFPIGSSSCAIWVCWRHIKVLKNFLGLNFRFVFRVWSAIQTKLESFTTFTMLKQWTWIGWIGAWLPFGTLCCLQSLIACLMINTWWRYNNYFRCWHTWDLRSIGRRAEALLCIIREINWLWEYSRYSLALFPSGLWPRFVKMSRLGPRFGSPLRIVTIISSIFGRIVSIFTTFSSSFILESSPLRNHV